jgi:diadenosine tetraphosphate (Ap4A) HIT family hydrolase
MSNPTARKFGFPQTLVAQTDYWLVLVRPKQPTYGSLVLICKQAAAAFSELAPEAFADLQIAVAGIERVLNRVVAYDKINYLMLMMVEPDVHFHVIPRYGEVFTDAGWPEAPNLGAAVDLSPEKAQRLATQLAAVWNAA